MTYHIAKDLQHPRNFFSCDIKDICGSLQVLRVVEFTVNIAQLEMVLKDGFQLCAPCGSYQIEPQVV